MRVSRAPARCSAKSTATRYASSRWARPGRQHARLVGRTVRRHACAAHRRHRHDPVIGESAVAAGVRRIEALTGNGARACGERTASRRAKAAAAELRTFARRMPARIVALIDERKQARARTRRCAQEAGDGRRRVGRRRRSRRHAHHRRRQVHGARRRRASSQGSEEPRRRRQEAARFRRRRHCRRHRRRQGRRRRRRHRRSHQALQRRRSGAQGSEALGGKGGGGRPDMAQAGGPDGSEG